MTGGLAADTIFALATPAGRGAVAVVRLSGPQAGGALGVLTARPLPSPRRAALRRLRAATGEIVDEALVLWMPEPASFTGEDSVELHLHGGMAVVTAVCDLLLDYGVRLAEPGEFTRRAFENGRLDLSQAEAVADLVDAESGAQRRQALAQLGGALSRRYDDWRNALLDGLALLEAGIDFADEDVPDGVGHEALPNIQRVHGEMQAAVADMRGERVREGFRVALVGAPNVGKSSLLNALAGRDAAIVTGVAGTTRDVVEVPITFAGQALVLADMAGLREADDPIEVEGVRRATAWAASADLRIGVVDLTRPQTWEAVAAHLHPQDIVALNKSDLGGASNTDGPWMAFQVTETVATVAGVGGLRKLLSEWAAGRGNAAEFPAVTRVRHREALREAGEDLQRALTAIASGVELAAEDVRLAIRSLERVTGRSSPEAVLDRVFASFCIGK